MLTKPVHRKHRVSERTSDDFTIKTIATDDFAKRIWEFVRPLENSGYETVAAFAHAGVLRGLLYEIIGARLYGKHVLCDNCMVAVFEYTKGSWRLHSWINP